MSNPKLRFLSVFVPDLDEAARRYEAFLGLAPIPAEQCTLAAAGDKCDAPPPNPHPFAAKGPVIFDLGGVWLALYQCSPQRGTHPGDTGIGILAEHPEQVAEYARKNQGHVFFGSDLAQDGRNMAVFVLPDRHFFEIISPIQSEP